MREQQEELHNWMVLAGQPVRDTPTVDIPVEERLLRARLVFEEAMEFVEAMGCNVILDDFGVGGRRCTKVILDEDASVDLIEAADALADIEVVTIGSAVTLGIDLDPVYAEVMRSNWDKFPGGVVTRDEGGKVLKPEGWTKPDIARVLKEQVDG